MLSPFDSMRGRGILLLLCAAGLPLVAAAQTTPQEVFEVSATKYLLGTQIDFKAMCAEVVACKKAFYAGFQEMERIMALLGSHKPESEISKINRHSGLKPVKVSYETFSIVKRAVAYSAEFHGAFDVTIGPVTELWGFNSDREVTIPRQDTLQMLLPLVNYRQVVLSETDTTVFLTRRGMRLDLGGIAKGYAIDRAAAVLKNHGLSHFLINAGGDIYACGYKWQDEPWLLGIQHPRKPQELLATFEVHDMAVATSGDYERYRIIDGKRYHHILNPATGFPSRMCESVSVFARSAEEADALATCLFVLGYEKAPDILPGKRVQTVIVDGSGGLHIDPSVKADYRLTVVDQTP